MQTSFMRSGKTRRKETMSLVSRCSLYSVSLICLSQTGRMTGRKVESRITPAKTDLFIVPFLELSRKRMQKLENVFRRKNTFDISKLPRFVCIPSQRCT